MTRFSHSFFKTRKGSWKKPRQDLSSALSQLERMFCCHQSRTCRTRVQLVQINTLQVPRCSAVGMDVVLPNGSPCSAQFSSELLFLFQMPQTSWSRRSQSSSSTPRRTSRSGERSRWRSSRRWEQLDPEPSRCSVLVNICCFSVSGLLQSSGGC